MATAKLMRPIAELRGSLKRHDSIYIRMMNGQCIFQQKPTRSSAKQQAMRQAFAERYGHKKAASSQGQAPIKSRSAT